MVFKKFGVVKELYDPYCVYLDIDSGRPDLMTLWKRLRVCKLRPEWMRIDRTLHGYHVVIRLQSKLSPWKILALQAILGSDPRREAMNWARLNAEPKSKFALRRWNILYEYKIERR